MVVLSLGRRLQKEELRPQTSVLLVRSQYKGDAEQKQAHPTCPVFLLPKRKRKSLNKPVPHTRQILFASKADRGTLKPKSKLPRRVCERRNKTGNSVRLNIFFPFLPRSYSWKGKTRKRDNEEHLFSQVPEYHHPKKGNQERIFSSLSFILVFSSNRKGQKRNP